MKKGTQNVVSKVKLERVHSLVFTSSPSSFGLFNNHRPINNCNLYPFLTVSQKAEKKAKKVFFSSHFFFCSCRFVCAESANCKSSVECGNINMKRWTWTLFKLHRASIRKNTRHKSHYMMMMMKTLDSTQLNSTKKNNDELNFENSPQNHFDIS